jgi:acyl-CoA thioesterase I
MRHALRDLLAAAAVLVLVSLSFLARAGEAPRLVVLGDSISAAYGLSLTDGWVALLANRLERAGYGYRVVNASVSGETTAGALARLPHVLEVHRPAIVLVELGGNDGLRGLPVDSARANLERIVTTIQDSGAAVVVLGMRMPPNYGAAYADAFAAMFGQVARSRKTALVPFLLAPIAAKDSNFQADRIHPTAAAQPALVDTVWPVLEPLLRRPPAISAAPKTKVP